MTNRLDTTVCVSVCVCVCVYVCVVGVGSGGGERTVVRSGAHCSPQLPSLLRHLATGWNVQLVNSPPPVPLFLGLPCHEPKNKATALTLASVKGVACGGAMPGKEWV